MLLLGFCAHTHTDIPHTQSHSQGGMCQFFLYNEVNQLYVYIYPLPHGPPSHPGAPSHPTPSHLGHHSTELSCLGYTMASHQYFTHVSVCMSIPTFQFIPLPSPPLSTCLFSMPASLFLPCKQVHLHRFSRVYIYKQYYTIFAFLFLTYFTLYDRTIGPSMSLQMT